MFSSLGKVLPCLSLVTGVRGIAGRSLRQALATPPRPPPFDYENKSYTFLRSMFDRTTHRFNANSKIVVVDGPMAVGKTAFAAQLAEELDMKHFAEPTLDLRYINQYGFDLRTIDDKVPEACRTFDHKNFCLTPNHRHAASYTIEMLCVRIDQYIDGLTHMLNTGQGVVLERSPYSDFVFADAMMECGFISKTARSVYEDTKNNVIGELLRPHLIIYLDVPVNVVKDRIKQRALPHEKNSEALSDRFLGHVEKQYKEKFLKDIIEHSEILVYDWTSHGDIEVIVEDIEKIDFECHTRYDDKKLMDWNLKKEMDWADIRMRFTNTKFRVMNLLNVPRLDCPELFVSGEDLFAYEQVLSNTPGFKFTYGYNADAGDTGLTFKNKLTKKNTDLVHP